MMLDIGLAASVLLNLVILLLLLLRRQDAVWEATAKHLAAGQERVEKALREELSLLREEAAKTAAVGREEQAQRFSGLTGELMRLLNEKGAEQQGRWDVGFRSLSGTLEAASARDAERFDGFSRATQERLETHVRQTLYAVGEMSAQQKGLLDSFAKQLTELTQINEQKLERLRESVEAKLAALQADNNTKLEQMRATVDEKLHQTLEQRLGDSFKLVSERLEQVRQSLGEMQSLASGVGDLKKVLSNVKTRGTLGEIQLENILEQTLSPDQYRVKAAVRPGTQERVDFAIALPGKEPGAAPIWLPIDAKFPLEDYQRLIDAEEAGDLNTALEAAKFLEMRIRQEAKSIQEKYIHPPLTTDFAILFLPIEGLFAEVLRRPGLWDSLQREHRVVLTGPTTITALLNSLQMGFRTLAIQQRSSEVWQLLGAVKTEFGRFGDILEKTQKKLHEATNQLDTAATRSRAIERKLKSVEAVPPGEAPRLLGDTDLPDVQDA